MNLLFLVKHLGEEPYKCKDCGQSFGNRDTMLRHVRLVHDGIKYPCQLCGKEFADRKGVKIHIRGVHEGKKLQS